MAKNIERVSVSKLESALNQDNIITETLIGTSDIDIRIKKTISNSFAEIAKIVGTESAQTDIAPSILNYFDNNGFEIKNYIIRTLGHSVTVFDVKGGFLNKKNKVVLTVVPSREYYRVTEGIKIIDKDAFFVVTDAYEVVGAK